MPLHWLGVGLAGELSVKVDSLRLAAALVDDGGGADCDQVGTVATPLNDSGRIVNEHFAELATKTLWLPQ